jgi:hypothetical protein
MKNRCILKTLSLFSLFVLVSIPANADVSILIPSVFVDRFPGNSQHLGFDKGNLLAVFALITSDDPLIEVTARNRRSGLVLYPTALEIGGIFSGLYQVFPLPPFNPDKHLGEWEIAVFDGDGNELATAVTHNLDKEAIMPYVKEIIAYGDPFAPTVTWREPKEKFIPEWCVLQHRLRLLTSSDDQFYRSSIINDPLSHTIPEGLITEENFYDTWVRIEFSCLDENDLPVSEPVSTELKSETFRPLSDLLSEGATQ